MQAVSITLTYARLFSAEVERNQLGHGWQRSLLERSETQVPNYADSREQVRRSLWFDHTAGVSLTGTSRAAVCPGLYQAVL